MEQPHPLRFLVDLPGILTGSAALITAATGGYLAFDRMLGQAGSRRYSPGRGSGRAEIARGSHARQSPMPPPAVVEPVPPTDPPAAPVRPAATAKRGRRSIARWPRPPSRLWCAATPGSPIATGGSPSNISRCAARCRAELAPPAAAIAKTLPGQSSGCATSQCLSDLTTFGCASSPSSIRTDAGAVRRGRSPRRAIWWPGQQGDSHALQFGLSSDWRRPRRVRQIARDP